MTFVPSMNACNNICVFIFAPNKFTATGAKINVVLITFPILQYCKLVLVLEVYRYDNLRIISYRKGVARPDYRAQTTHIEVSVNPQRGRRGRRYTRVAIIDVVFRLRN